MTSIWLKADLLTPMALRVAATLRLADLIGAGRASSNELAERVHANHDALTRLLRHLATVGIVNEVAPSVYELTSEGRELREDHPSGIRAWLDLNGAVGRADLAFMRLLDTVRSGEPAYPLVFGRPFWDDLDADPALSLSLDALMGKHPAIQDVVQGFDWQSIDHVVDVGGGNGALLVAVLTEHRHLRGTLVERRLPAQTAHGNIEEAGLLDRCTIVARSFFEPLPTGGDVYMLSRVIDDWDDEHAIQILRRCATAAGPDGTVLVIEEGPLGDEIDEPASTEMDMRMLVYVAGRNRTFAELRALLAAAGLTVASSTIGDHSTLVRALPTR